MGLPVETTEAWVSPAARDVSGPAYCGVCSPATLRLLAAGVFLPNALSFATLASIIDIGLPPRTSAIFLYGVVALSARRAPLALTWLLFVIVLAFDLVWTISLMFGLAPTELLAALDHVQRVNVFASPLYVGLLVTIGVTSVATLRLLRRRHDLLQGSVRVLFAAVLLAAAVDVLSNTSAHFHFNAMFGRNQPVTSAADVSGFNAAAGANGRNVVVVMVESFGYLLDPAARRRIAAPLEASAITARYDVTSGHAGYFGSTTAGEMRELCGTREPYLNVAAASGTRCLPSRLQRAGYATLAVHGFFGEMFSRRTWYPQVGFNRALFGEELGARVARRCGNAFRGTCDADLTPLIAREAARTSGPRFIYWLTLNTHIPVSPGEARIDFGCAGDEHGFGVPRVCRMAELWHDLFASVAKLALDPAIAPAEILIVGDHAPPLWSKRGRGQFVPGEVAWYRLTPR
jgi:hypothetical protein